MRYITMHGSKNVKFDAVSVSILQYYS